MIKKFYSSNCAPCKMMAPVIDAVTTAHNIELIEVCTDDEAGAKEAREHGVTTLPTMVLYNDGVSVGTIVGPLPKPQVEQKLRLLGIIG